MAVLKVQGQQKAQASLVNGPYRFNQGLRTAGHKSGHILKQATQHGIRNGSKSGRMYGGHQASAAGEYSAFLSGAHFRSIDYKVNGSHSFEFGAGTAYSAFLEEGTSKMDPREDLGQSVRNEQSRVTRILGQIPYSYLARG